LALLIRLSVPNNDSQPGLAFLDVFAVQRDKLGTAERAGKAQ
jgi:hypothetical protein